MLGVKGDGPSTAMVEQIMNWLSQNWLWVVLGLGALWWFLSRGGLGGRRRLGYHGPGTSYEPDRSSEDRERMVARSMSDAPTSGMPATAIDPVSRQDVSTGQAVTSVYQGRIYYFQSAENRQRFEQSPQQYARPELGQPLGQGQSPGGAEQERPRRRGGC